MALAPGVRLGPYEIAAQIGEGGMGEVYQATDTNLKRAVAIKVLPESLASDAERLARFQREAEVLAALNHSNIAQIHGLEKSAGTIALVMELVEGPTLADRIAQGAIPIDEALPIAKQIAEALEAAHEQGIIHRDLKPANIKVRPDGTVKVLDFGLAKALEPTAMSPDSSQSPTITTPAMTQAGMILGTAAYMSPEQAKGKAVDKRSDVWAFGAVLYEMLTGRRPFEGEDVSETLARVIEREPDWSRLPAKTDGLVARLLRRCLEKDRNERLPDIRVARLDLKEALQTTSNGAANPSRIRPAWLVSAAMLAVLAGLVGWSLARPERASPPVTRTSIFLNENTQLANLVFPVVGSRVWSTPLALSQDGRTVYFTGEQDGVRRIYQRALGRDEAEAVRGTEGADLVFLSPDGESLGFSVQGQLKRMRLDGEAPVTFYEGRVGYSQWGPDNTVVFEQNGDLWQIDALGGEPKRITSGAYLQILSLLPGGQAVLAANSSMGSQVLLVPLPQGEPRALTVGTNPQFVPSGHIVFLRGTSLWAIPFDLDRLEVTGSAVQVLEGVVEQGMLPNYTLSPSGSLVYVPARTAARSQQLVWVDREGREELLGVEPGDYRIPRVSPDGSRVVFDDCCRQAIPLAGC